MLYTLRLHYVVSQETKKREKNIELENHFYNFVIPWIENQFIHSLNYY